MNRQHTTAYYAISGAGTDLGTGLAWRLAELGFNLLLIDDHEAVLTELADQLESAGHSEPLLAVINPFQTDFEAQCLQLAQSSPPLSGFCWAGAWLDQPTPFLNETLTHWQKGIGINVTAPLSIIKSLHKNLTSEALIWLALPQARAFTNQLGAASCLWSSWIPILNQEIGTTSSHKIRQWVLPRLADRVHRRIFPLAELSEFTPIDTAIDAWLFSWMNDE